MAAKNNEKTNFIFKLPVELRRRMSEAVEMSGMYTDASQLVRAAIVKECDAIEDEFLKRAEKSALLNKEKRG